MPHQLLVFPELAVLALVTLLIVESPSPRPATEDEIKGSSAADVLRFVGPLYALLTASVCWHVLGQARALLGALLAPDASRGFVLAGLVVILVPPLGLYALLFRLRQQPLAGVLLIGLESGVLLAALARLALYRDVPSAWQHLFH